MYPTFAYNAVGGGGHATAEDLGNGLLRLVFDPQVSRGGGGGDATAEDLGNGLLRLVFDPQVGQDGGKEGDGNLMAKDLSTASHLSITILTVIWGRKLSS